jgi:diguanylate cyclase (GGDEF)-like protein/PAS domain S-box-containing protein
MSVLLSATAITDKAGNFVMGRSTLYDITERKQVEKSLLEAEKNYRVVFENTGTATIIFDEDMIISLANKECEKLSGYSKEEIEGKKRWTDFVLKNDLGKMKEYHLMRRAYPNSVPKNYEFRMVDRHGKVKNIYLTIDMLPGTKKSIASLLDITERKNAEQALKESEEKFRDLFENANDSIQVVDGKGKYLYVNRKWREMLGFTEEEIKRLLFTDILKKELIPHCMENFGRIVRGESIENLETIYVSKDGRELYLEGNMSPSFKDGNFVSCRGIFRDITERKKAEEALKASEAELHDNYFIQSAINMILRESLENKPFEEFLQKALHMILAVPWIAFESIGSISVVEDDADVLVMKAQSNIPERVKKICKRIPLGKCLCGKAAETQKPQFADHVDERHEICYEGLLPHGHYSVPILYGRRTLGVLNIYLKEGHIRDKREEELLSSVADTLAGIIMRKKAEERIEYLAYYDALTGLPNRNLFIDRLKQGIARAEPTSKIAAVMITDIDRFKSINDAYGPEVGDRVLHEVAERLTTAVRRGDTVARLGNDEFGIALVDVADTDDVIQVLEKMMKYISYPLRVNNEEITLTFSTGISIYPYDNKTPQDLLKSAGLALEIAKKEGRKTYQFYTEDLNVKASEFLLMEKNLYNAIQNEEFLLHYQPYWDINTQKMVGIEALIRWQSKDNGLVPPGKFIPVLEDTGMIIEVGQWILREAIRQVK